ncbi:hypothetical protein WN943_024254 [Citrus x changshan-huyou]
MITRAKAGIFKPKTTSAKATSISISIVKVTSKASIIKISTSIKTTSKASTRIKIFIPVTSSLTLISSTSTSKILIPVTTSIFVPIILIITITFILKVPSLSYISHIVAFSLFTINTLIVFKSSLMCQQHSIGFTQIHGQYICFNVNNNMTVGII